MSEAITVMWYDARDPFAETSWQQADMPHQGGMSVKHYLRSKIGLIGLRSNRSLRRFDGTNYVRINMNYVPGPGEVIAMVPKGW